MTIAKTVLRALETATVTTMLPTTIGTAWAYLACRTVANPSEAEFFSNIFGRFALANSACCFMAYSLLKPLKKKKDGLPVLEVLVTFVGTLSVSIDVALRFNGIPSSVTTQFVSDVALAFVTIGAPPAAVALLTLSGYFSARDKFAGTNEKPTEAGIVATSKASN
jgi:hypothetical protein